jgi:hypothetical protein
VLDTEPVAKQSERLRMVLTRRIIVGRIKKSSSPPLTRTRNAGSGTSMTAEQCAREIVRALEALYVRRAKKGKWRTERSNDSPLRLPKIEPGPGRNDVSSDSGDSQPCGLQATLSPCTEAANGDFNEAPRAAGIDALQTLADPCQSLRTQAALRGDNNATFSHRSASKQHARCNSVKKSVRFADSDLNSGPNGDVSTETPTRDEPGDTEIRALVCERFSPQCGVGPI